MSRIHWQSNTLSPGLAAFPAKLDAALGAYMEYEETKVQDHMRSTAPWTDRTGNARQGLFARAYRRTGGHGIVCYHTMPYGIWLEVKNSGQYAVIVPTIQTEGRRILAGVNTLLAKMRAVS